MKWEQKHKKVRYCGGTWELEDSAIQWECYLCSNRTFGPSSQLNYSNLFTSTSSQELCLLNSWSSETQSVLLRFSITYFLIYRPTSNSHVKAGTQFLAPDLCLQFISDSLSVCTYRMSNQKPGKSSSILEVYLHPAHAARFWLQPKPCNDIFYSIKCMRLSIVKSG